MGPDGQPTGFDLSLTGADPSRPETQGRPAWSMAGSGGTRPSRRRAGRRRGRAGRLAGWSRARPAARRDEAAGPPRPRRLDRLRACRRVVLLLADGDDGARQPDHRWQDARRRRQRLVRSPVGRLHLGRWRRVGLVRREPRRRHRPHALARARRGRHLPARVRHGRRGRRVVPPSRSRTPSRSRSPTTGRARRLGRSTRPAGRSGSPART